ncbi:TPA: VaFE repeat-containing surface-anchored protein [Enterococcus faecalis]|uniref:SpaA isopeptide-forming pilin-related protein n=1 Tax=Enterococcus raffinosus TaxID=71452 RepID=UPI002AB435CD|nr:VaFE repeat-containing surface-anchored protein [Enterococcus faecalis]HEM7730194.1 VaFE repeat-containing surface-anchored protein [Enterococcus faecalis]
MNSKIRKHSFLKGMLFVLFANMFLFGGNTLVNAAETTDSTPQTMQTSNEQIVVQQEQSLNDTSEKQVSTQTTQENQVTSNEKRNMDATIGEEQNSADSPAVEQPVKPTVDSEETEQSAESTVDSKEAEQPAEPTVDSMEAEQPTEPTVDSKEAEQPIEPTVGSKEAEQPVKATTDKKEVVKSRAKRQALPQQKLDVKWIDKGINWIVYSAKDRENFTMDRWAKFYVNGEVAFCIEPNKEAAIGAVHTGANLDTLFKDQALRNKLTMISHFGYIANKDQSDEQYIATQMLIWELLGAKYHTIYNGLNYEARKADILKSVKEAEQRASFHKQKKSIKVGEKGVFVDTNNTLSNVKGIRTPSGVNAKIEGNKLIVTADKNAPDNATIHLDRITIVGTPLVYTSGNAQKIGVLKPFDPLDSWLTLQVIKNGNVKIFKEDTETGNKAQGKATIEGAKYGLYKEDGTKVAEVTLKNVNGKVQAEVKDLAPIKYYFQEIQAPKGYTLSTDKLFVSVPAGETAVITAKDRVIKGNINGYKVGNKELVATTNSDIKPKLAGVELQAKSKTTGKVVKTTTDKNGYFEFKGLAYDDYEISETKGMEGYKLIQPFTVTIEKDGQTINYVLEDKIIEQKLKVVKVDQETGKTIALAGTQFKIWDKLANNGKGGYVSMALPNDTELSDVFTTNDKGYFVTTDTLRYGKDRYELREIKAPEKYVLNTTPYVFSVTSDTDTIQVINFANRLAKANVEVFKYDTTTNFDKKTAIAGVEFDLYKKDETGKATFVGTFKTDVDGKIKVNDLLVGDYWFKEVNPLAGYQALDKDVPFTVTVEKDGTVIALEVENKRIPPKIGTTAMGKFTNQQKVNPLSRVTITDAVKYSNLIVGKTYTVNGVLMDKEASIQAGKDVPLLVNGKEVTASKVFVAENPDGTIALDFVFDASALAGKETVVFENVYRDGRLVASHTDIHDKGQTIRIVNPTIHTKATGQNGEKQLQALPNQKVKEWVQLNDLIVGQMYKLLVQGYITPDGMKLDGTSAEKIFKADKETLEFLFEFLVDGSKLEGKGLSFAEWLEAQVEPDEEKPSNEIEFKEMAKHNVDLTSEEQTVNFVKVPTPEKPHVPNTPETPKEVKTSAILPKTGEQTNSTLMVLGLTVLAFALGVILYKVRKVKD